MTSEGLDYLVIGNVTKDVVPGGFVFGGTVSFSSLTGRNLGRRTGVLTRCAPLPELSAYLQDVALHVVPAEETTTFENIYTSHGRVQYLRAVAPPIPQNAVPEAWRRTPVVHLGPIAQEVPPELADTFAPGTLVGATPQGWLRAWDESGLVRHIPWHDVERALARVDVLVFSVEDVGGDRKVAETYAQAAQLGVITEDRNGCTVWQGSRSRHFPAFVAQEVDPTGAGDVFTAAFLLRYGETRDAAEAARFANCAASFAVEGRGTAAIPTLEQVADRLRAGKQYPL